MAQIGIDFGTTNSLIVAYDKQEKNGDGFHYFRMSSGRNPRPLPTSSTVWYHDGEIEVGDNARNKINEFGDVEGHHFEKSVKLKLDSDQHLNIFGKSVEPSEVAGTILRHLKEQAKTALGSGATNVDLNRAVFTIPISFTGKARRNLRKSANSAGIEVKTFIHEPFAAVVGYMFTKYGGQSFEAIIKKMKELNGKYILVFDWGGGTLDITVVLVKDGKMLEMGTSEMTGKAGDRFDEDLAKEAWNDFIDKYGSKYSQEFLETVRRKKWDRLVSTAERCKIELSRETVSDFLIEDVIADREDIDISFTRDHFKDLISRYLDEASYKVQDALKNAGIGDIDITYVLLTGGTSYIPAVRERMVEIFGHRVEEVRNADLLIAQGAAVISEMGWLPFLTKDIMIELSDGSYWPIFEHDMPLSVEKEPSKNSEVFTCTDSTSKRAKIIVCEGERQNKNTNLGILNVPILGDHRFGDDIVVEAELDRDIVLTVRGHSKMVNQYDVDYSERKTTEIVKLCYGLDFAGGQ